MKLHQIIKNYNINCKYIRGVFLSSAGKARWGAIAFTIRYGLPVLQKHRGHPSGAGIGSMKKPFGQLRIHCIAPRQEGLDDVVRDLVEDNVLEDEDDNVDVVCNRVVRVVEVCGVDVVDIGVVFCCVITGDDVSGGLVVTTCDVVPVVVVDWVEAGCNVMAWAIKNIARS